jgi:hypothetical protein
MKIFTSLLTLFACLVLFSLKGEANNADHHEEIIQLAPQANSLKNKLKTGPDGEYLPIVLITNDKVPADLHPYFEGQLLRLVSGIEEAQALGENFSFVELKEIEVKDGKAKLFFQLDDYKIKVKLKKEADEWRRSYSSAKKFVIDLDI